MRTTHFPLGLLAMFAAACASSPDRAPAHHNHNDDRSMTHTDDTRSTATDHDKTDKTGQTGTTPERAGPPPLMIVGVLLEPTLASACGITLPPAAFFQFNSAALDVPDNSSLRDVATCLSTGPLKGRKVELIGHTDPSGNDEYNRQLGRSRAQSVEHFLQKQGVAHDNIVTRSVGETTSEQDPRPDWPLDRRVDIRLLPEE